MKNFSDDTEYEAKFYPIDKDVFRELLKKVGATLITPERKFRRAIVHQKDFPQLKHHYIRVRDEGDVIRISAKTHAEEGGSLSDQKEIDIVVDDYDKAIKLIESMGFRFNTYQETLRETWELEGAEITLDSWPGLLPLSEIEASSEEEVKRLAEVLRLDWDKRIITSPIEIFMKVYHLSFDEAWGKTVHLTFEDNPFAEMEADNSWTK